MTYIPSNDTLLGRRIVRPPENLPATTTTNIFTITGGAVSVCRLVGRVTTAVQAVSNLSRLIFNPVEGAALQTTAPAEINGYVLGRLIELPDLPTELWISGVGQVAAGDRNQSAWTFQPGDLQLETTATSTGQIEWTLFYVPITSGATVVAP